MSDQIHSKDWPAESMLQEAQEFLKKESEKYPIGLKGAIVIFAHTDDRYQEGQEKKDEPYLLFHAGLSYEEIFILLEKARISLMKGLFKEMEKEDEDDEQS